MRLPGHAPLEAAWILGCRPVPAGVELRHGGKVFVNDQNTEFAGAYAVFNLRAGLQQRGNGWKFTEYVRIDNVRDKAYIGSVIVSEANGRYYEPAPGRNYSVGISAEFSC